MPLKKSLLGFAIVSSLVNAISAQAAAATSMTIVEIGSSGVGTSAAGTGAGIFYFGAEVGNGIIAPGGKNFTSIGTTDSTPCSADIQAQSG